MGRDTVPRLSTLRGRAARKGLVVHTGSGYTVYHRATGKVAGWTNGRDRAQLALIISSFTPSEDQ